MLGGLRPRASTATASTTSGPRAPGCRGHGAVYQARRRIRVVLDEREPMEERAGLRSDQRAAIDLGPLDESATRPGEELEVAEPAPRRPVLFAPAVFQAAREYLSQHWPYRSNFSSVCGRITRASTPSEAISKSAIWALERGTGPVEHSLGRRRHVLLRQDGAVAPRAAASGCWRRVVGACASVAPAASTPPSVVCIPIRRQRKRSRRVTGETFREVALDARTVRDIETTALAALIP
jgi:hypothetical protein